MNEWKKPPGRPSPRRFFSYRNSEISSLRPNSTLFGDEGNQSVISIARGNFKNTETHHSLAGRNPGPVVVSRMPGPPFAGTTEGPLYIEKIRIGFMLFDFRS
ncbi:hypothetical protein AUK22_01405 [bacterium CG2_30_54_10]|nr:MAG: hypothetical protein AUK22_01405 [bacterium CG2_30_54_10]